MNESNIYPRTGDRQTVYLKHAVKDPSIIVGDYTIYNDFVYNPVDFEKNNVLYHYPVNQDRLVIGKFCSIACGARFLFNSANHTLQSSPHIPSQSFERWGLERQQVAKAWDNKGDIVIGNDVWIGYEAVILAGGDRWRRGCHRRQGRCDKRCTTLYHRRWCPCKANPKAVF